MNSYFSPSDKRFFVPIAISVFVILSCIMTACDSSITVSPNPQNGTTLDNFTLIDRLNTASVTFGKTTTVTASCNPGERVVSGGYSLSPTTLTFTMSTLDESSKPYVALRDSYPASATSWSVTVANESTDANAGSVLVIAHAVCTPSAVFTQIISSTQQLSSDQSIPDGTKNPWTVAACPSQTVLLGGGFSTATTYNYITTPVVSDAYLADTTSLVPTGWKAHTTLIDSAGTITAYAICTIPHYLISPKAKPLDLYATVTGYQGLGAAPTLTSTNEYTYTRDGADSCGNSTIETSSGFAVPENIELTDNAVGPNNYYGFATFVQTLIPDYHDGTHGSWDTRYTIYDLGWYSHTTGGWQPSGNFNYQSYSVYIRSICVQVIQGATPTPAPTDTATPVATDTPTIAPSSTPSGAPPAKPTSTATKTPPTPTPSAPLCTPQSSGTQTLNVDNAYLNLLTGAVAMSSNGAHLYWTQSPATGWVIAPINGAQTASTAGTAFSSITCSQIKNASYSASDIPAGSVAFLVKISSAEFAKVQMRYVVGTADVSLTWQTYTIS